jgi:hypothetical protein
LTTLRTSFVPIWQAIVTQILNWPGFSGFNNGRGIVPSQVILVSPGRTPPNVDTIGDQYLILMPRAVDPELRREEGGGRTDKRARRTLDIIVRSRLALDEIDRDTLFLTSYSQGVIPLEETVLDCLIDFQPQDSFGNLLTDVPLKWIVNSEPRREPVQEGYGQVVVSFEVPYLLPISQTFL